MINTINAIDLSIKQEWIYLKSIIKHMVRIVNHALR